MKNLLYILFLMFLTSQIACSQNQNISLDSTNKEISQSVKEEISDERVKNLVKQVNEFLQATFNEDLSKLSKFVYYPKIISGSTEEIQKYKENNASKIIQGTKLIKTQGFEIIEGKAETSAEIVEAENQLFSIVPIITIAKNKEKKCEIKDFLLGISQDNGKNWEFFIGNNSFQKQFALFFPDASKKITLPEKPEPNCYEE